MAEHGAVFAIGSYLYLGTEDNVMCIHDISNPFSTSEIGTVSLDGTPTGIWIDSGLAYVICSNGILHVIDIDDPVNPAILTDGTVDTGESFSHIRVAGQLILLSGSSASTVAIYDALTLPPTEIFATKNISGSQATLQGRRVFFGDSSGTLRNFRLGGFRCSSIVSELLQSKWFSTILIHALHGYFRGEVVADMVGAAGGHSDTDSGVVWAANYLKVGGMKIEHSEDDPEGVITAPSGSLCLAETGKVYIKASGTGDTGWLAIVTV